MYKFKKKKVNTLLILFFICFSFSLFAKKTDQDIKSPMSEKQRISFSKAKTEDITDKNYPEIIDNFDYQDAKLIDVIYAISKLTGKSFIIDPAVSTGKITILAPTPMTVAQVYRVFLSALAMNNYTIVPIPNTHVLKIRRVQDAITDSIDFYSHNSF